MYIYQADVWCDSCGERIRADLRGAGKVPTYARPWDSDDWPDGGYPDDEATDCPQHCAAGDECLDPIDLTEWGLPADARMLGAATARIGALLGTGLTNYGVEGLRDMLEEPAPTEYQQALHRFWKDAFADYL